MNAARLRLWVLLLLPLFAARALVPVGYMLSAEHGALQMVLCSGSGPVPSLTVVGAHEHHSRAHNEHGQQHSGVHESSVCPYALAAMACLSGFVSTLPFSFAPFSSAPEFYPDAVRVSDRLGLERIRGPPALPIALS